MRIATRIVDSRHYHPKNTVDGSRDICRLHSPYGDVITYDGDTRHSVEGSYQMQPAKNTGHPRCFCDLNIHNNFTKGRQVVGITWGLSLKVHQGDYSCRILFQKDQQQIEALPTHCKSRTISTDIANPQAGSYSHWMGMGTVMPSSAGAESAAADFFTRDLGMSRYS